MKDVSLAKVMVNNGIPYQGLAHYMFEVEQVNLLE